MQVQPPVPQSWVHEDVDVHVSPQSPEPQSCAQAAAPVHERLQSPLPQLWTHVAPSPQLIETAPEPPSTEQFEPLSHTMLQPPTAQVKRQVSPAAQVQVSSHSVAVTPPVEVPDG